MWGIHIVVSVHTNTHREGSLLVSCQPKNISSPLLKARDCELLQDSLLPSTCSTVGGHVTCLMRKWRNSRWSSSAHLTFSLGEGSALLQSGYDRLAHCLMLIFSIRKTFPLTPHCVFLPSSYSILKVIFGSHLPYSLSYISICSEFRSERGCGDTYSKISTFNELFVLFISYGKPFV